MCDPNHTPKRILITAGPTREPIDAVRYIGNRSSGRMGVALAAAAVAAGHPTTLALGPASSAASESSLLTVRRFQTTTDLANLLAELWPAADVLIMAAAVADFRPRRTDEHGKISRGDGALTLELEPTPDLLASLAPLTRPDQLVIGFALEPEDRLEASARDKLRRKALHAIVANPLETMDAPTVTARVLLANGDELAPAPDLAKSAFAGWLIRQLPAIAIAGASST
jgi:phosphopantothenoylcysteine decarboxylase/phosphopantothenate--cysteine ligase